MTSSGSLAGSKQWAVDPRTVRRPGAASRPLSPRLLGPLLTDDHDSPPGSLTKWPSGEYLDCDQGVDRGVFPIMHQGVFRGVFSIVDHLEDRGVLSRAAELVDHSGGKASILH